MIHTQNAKAIQGNKIFHFTTLLALSIHLIKYFAQLYIHIVIMCTCILRQFPYILQKAIIQ